MVTKPRVKGFAAQVRAVLQEMAVANPVSVQEVAQKLDLISNADKQPMYTVFRDFLKSGEIERTAPDMFRYRGRKSQQKPELREIMWRLLRAKKHVTQEDLAELSGAEASYVKEWINMLIRQEVVKVHSKDRTTGIVTYVLIQDPEAMPTDDTKAERLRTWRERKKDALAALDTAMKSVLDARLLVSNLEAGAEKEAS